MNKDTLSDILKKLAEHKITTEKALSLLKDFPFKDIGIAKIDTHRDLRRNFPEALFGLGKTKEQILSIALEMSKTISPFLITKIQEETYKFLKPHFKNLRYFKDARLIQIGTSRPQKTNHTVSIVCAGTSDIPIAEEAAVTLEVFGYPVKKFYDIGIAGLQRLLDVYKEIEKSALIITAAGMEGALPGVLSGLINKPIIAVPTSIGYGANFQGLSALLSMLNSCSPGITVVNIDNGFGAAYSAALILSIFPNP